MIVSCLQDMACNDPLPRKRIKKIVATSILADKAGRYGVESLVDGNPKTAWCEGRDNSGVGERVTLELSKPTRLEKILISPMYAKSAATIAENNKVKWVTIKLDDLAFRLVVDGYVDDECGGDAPCPEPADLQSWDVPSAIRTRRVTKVEVVIDAVLKGAKFDDTCLSAFGVVELEEDRPEE